MNAQVFADRIRERLHFLRKKQVELAKEIDVSTTTVNTWLSGRNHARPALMPKLCEALQTTSAYLYGETNDPDQSAHDGPGGEGSHSRRESTNQRYKKVLDKRLEAFGRPACLMHPNVWERAESLLDYYEAVTIDEVVAKVINERYTEIVKGQKSDWRRHAHKMVDWDQLDALNRLEKELGHLRKTSTEPQDLPKDDEDSRKFMSEEEREKITDILVKAQEAVRKLPSKSVDLFFADLRGGFDEDGFDKYGFDRHGNDKDGFDVDGVKMAPIDRDTATPQASAKKTDPDTDNISHKHDPSGEAPKEDGVIKRKIKTDDGK